MRVCVVGSGYVGLTTGVCLAERGHRVACVDVDREKVERINHGDPLIHEIRLQELLERNLGTRFRATWDLREAVRDSELTLITVGTPFDGRRIDLRFMADAAREIGEALRGGGDYHTVAVKSTVVPGTTETLVREKLETASGRTAGEDLGLGMNPEFLTEGRAVRDFMEPDRIVLGGLDDRSRDALERLYEDFAGVPRLRTNLRTAEMIKYASNAMLATAISFSNELANLCAALGELDVTEVTRGLHLSYYLSPFLEDGSRVTAPLASFFEAGCGYGGSCLPKDVKALVAHGRDAGEPMELLGAVDRINDAQPHRILDLLRRHFPSLEGAEVSVLGIAFKPDTGDVRESPAIPIIQDLKREGARITIYDPVARPPSTLERDPAVGVATNLVQALEAAEVVVIVTRWSEFLEVPGLLADMGRSPLVVDGRRMLPRGSVSRYDGIGL